MVAYSSSITVFTAKAGKTVGPADLSTAKAGITDGPAGYSFT